VEWTDDPDQDAARARAHAGCGPRRGGCDRGRRAAVRPGVTTGELDAIAEDHIRSAGAVPSFLGYHGFTGSICASINDEIVHGIPNRSRTLAEGDNISIDCGAILQGWHGDSAVTVTVGPPSARTPH
jgi:methionyl aminopeptidase